MMVKGLTFLEILVVLLFLLIIQFFVIPTMHHLLMINRVNAVINQLRQAIRVARNIAIQRQRVTQLCGSSDQNTCDGHWENGQIIVLPASGKVLEHYQGLQNGCHLYWRSSFRRNHFLNFTARGFTQGQQGTFYCCPNKNSAKYGKGIVVSHSGRTRNLQDLKKLRTFCFNFTTGFAL